MSSARRSRRRCRFRPEEWGMKRGSEDARLHVPQPGAAASGHARRAARDPAAGWRGDRRRWPATSASTIAARRRWAERQSWHTYIPYTDRIDYLGGVMNNLAYVLAVEKLAGIEVPDRAKVIRIMLSELFRITATWSVLRHLRAGCRADVAGLLHVHRPRARLRHHRSDHAARRMHPSWFRIGGVAQDLPQGWETLVQDFIGYLPGRLERIRARRMRNRIFKARTIGVGDLSHGRSHRVGRHRPDAARPAAWRGISARSGPTRL